MQVMIDFDIKLPCDQNNPDYVVHLKEKSVYNHHYFKIKPYGDWLYGKADIVLQEYYEDGNCYGYSFGYFEDEKFIPVLNWTTDKDIFEDINL